MRPADDPVLNGRFVLGRLLILVVTLAIGSFLVYSALYFAPGDPISMLLGGRRPTPEVRAALEERYHLNDPFITRYGAWLLDALRGDLGTSATFQTPVSSVLGARAGVTLTLGGMAGAIVFAVGLTLGRTAARFGGMVDIAISTFLTISLATPAFVVSIVLISVFGVSLGWFPVFGQGEGLVERIRHLVLPSIAMATGMLALLAQTTRQAVREELESEHVAGARARGLPRRHVVRRHVLRNAAIPISTSAGLTVAALFGGSAIVEVAFGINGLGSLFVQSIAQKDFAVVQALTLLGFVVFGITNLAVDVLYGFLDPRLRGRVG